MAKCMHRYETSEQLFVDIWEKYGLPDEVDDPNTIFNILQDLIDLSKHQIVLDHYSHINFDEIIKVEYDEENTVFKLYWLDNNKYRIAHLNQKLSEDGLLIWQLSGFCTYEYLAIDINKIRFLKIRGHIYILIQSNMITAKELKKRIVGKNEIIEIEECTNNLYARYTFWDGDKENMIKIECIANNLPYYVCIIQPKENILSTGISRTLMLISTLEEIKKRLRKVQRDLKLADLDRDELFSKGNTIRVIMEYALKHFCVVMGIPIEIEQKYGHIELRDLKKKIISNTEIEIPQNLINMANELSHDSGKKYSLDDIKDFLMNVMKLIDEIQEYIYNKEQVKK